MRTRNHLRGADDAHVEAARLEPLRERVGLGAVLYAATCSVIARLVADAPAVAMRPHRDALPRILSPRRCWRCRRARRGDFLRELVVSTLAQRGE